MPTFRGRGALRGRKVRRRYDRRRPRRPRPNLRQRRRSVLAKRKPRAGHARRGRTPTIAEALFIAEQLRHADDGHRKMVAYFALQFRQHPVLFVRLLRRALADEADEADAE